MKISKRLAFAAAAGAIAVLCVVSMFSGPRGQPAGDRILADKFAGLPSPAGERTAVLKDDRGRRFIKRIVVTPEGHDAR